MTLRLRRRVTRAEQPTDTERHLHAAEVRDRVVANAEPEREGASHVEVETAAKVAADPRARVASDCYRAVGDIRVTLRRDHRADPGGEERLDRLEAMLGLERVPANAHRHPGAADAFRIDIVPPHD